jgi:long-chain acyl-CoA synthetase
LFQHVTSSPLSKQWGVGLYAINRPEWIISEHALYSFSLFPVALYDTLGPDASAYIVNHAELPIVIATLDKIPNLLEVVKTMPELKVIVSMDSLASGEGRAVKGWAAEKGLVVVDFGEVEKIGRENRRTHKPPQPDDILTIMWVLGVWLDFEIVIS